MTAASRIAGWAASASSTSAGNTFSPPETIMSSSRPSMNNLPAVVEVPDVAAGTAGRRSIPWRRRRCSRRTGWRCRRRCGPAYPVGRVAAVVVEELDHRAGHALPDAAGLARQIHRRGDRGVGDLGGTVHVVDDRAEDFDAPPCTARAPSCDPATNMIRSAERSLATENACGPRSISRRSMMGTAIIAVARCSARLCRVVCGSKRRRTTSVEPSSRPEHEMAEAQRVKQRNAALGDLARPKRRFARATRPPAAVSAARNAGRPWVSRWSRWSR